MTHQAPLYAELIERGAVQHATRVAMVVADVEYSFAEVNARANRYGRALQSVGAVHGERVALLINNSVASIPMDFACAKTGINRVPLNSRLSRDEHIRMIREADCRFIVCDPELEPRAVALKTFLPDLEVLVLGASDGGVNLELTARSQPDLKPDYTPVASDVILTLYTSGTTGVLKAAQHTQASFAAVSRNILLNLFAAGPDDAMLHAASLIHASGTFVLPLWIRGGRSIVLTGFSPAEFVANIQRHRVTAINVVPTMLQMLLDDPVTDQHDLSSLERIIYGASPMPRTVIERAIQRFGQQRFWQYYGQTEIPLAMAVLRPEDHHGALLGGCGRPSVDIELRLVGPEGEWVEPGEPGEILARGASAAVGYYRADALSAETFDAEGWVHTRDIGIFDDKGVLHLRDRTSDMIITGGYNVYPREVEDVLMQHPAVDSAAVVGAPNDKWVEAVVAYVVLRPGETADAAELIATVGAAIASYKKPHWIEFCASIPTTAIGKTDRKALRGLARDQNLGQRAPPTSSHSGN
ncbi:MAG: AMP-binding protein [Proteobacteria bacterium]|nr:AMP-binding protein [Pseudomonadota bacterium]